MFNQIATRYDLINHVLSLGLDILWRHSLTQFLPKRKDLVILDLATGTGDVLISLCLRNKNIKQAYGIDLAEKMLDIGRLKVNRVGLNSRIILDHGDANQIPYPDGLMDAVTMAFGIRNVEDPVRVLKEMVRVLKPNGSALILEFSLPRFLLLKWFHLIYLKTVVPLLGGLISGNFEAYGYLSRSIPVFPCGEAFLNLMRQAGLQTVRSNPMIGRIATLYQGEK